MKAFEGLQRAAEIRVLGYRRYDGYGQEILRVLRKDLLKRRETSIIS